MDILISDGGTGRELQRRGVEIPNGTWSADALFVAPDIVKDVHLTYLNKGSHVVTTNTYSCTPDVANILDTSVEEMINIACNAAKQAIEEYQQLTKKKGFIAGSIPPLADSHRPDLVLSPEDARPAYENMIRSLAPQVNILLVETMSSIAESLVPVSVAASELGLGLPVWVSFELHDDGSGRLRSGESVEDMVNALKELNVPLFAITFNCSTPEAVDVALTDLIRLAPDGVRVGAYPNALGQIPENFKNMALDLREDLSVELVGGYYRSWIERGATILGGCCGLGPAYIEALAKIVSELSQDIEGQSKLNSA